MLAAARVSIRYCISQEIYVFHNPAQNSITAKSTHYLTGAKTSSLTRYIKQDMTDMILNVITLEKFELFLGGGVTLMMCRRHLYI